MGNVACVPPAPGRLRGSFGRKPSLRKEKDGKKKLPSFFGTEGGQERDTTTDKILQYIPAKNIQNQENQKENLDQRFPSLFKKGRRKTVVRNLGKIIYYSKVKFKFQHCQVSCGSCLWVKCPEVSKVSPRCLSFPQEVNDCYLELFQSYLYFQSMGSNGLTYQGLLPLKELNVCEIANVKGPEEHAFRITGPLLNPLIVFCPTESELKQWLYHLEKQIQLNGGSLGLPLLSQSAWKGSSLGKEELRWSVQNSPVQEWRGTQRESLGDVLCVSKVKLQHLPFQEQHDRLLVLYPSTLVIVSEERNSLYFKGELPLNAVQVRFDKNEKTSFLIEGRLINSIRVICPSYDDYQEWLYCLKTAQFRNADSSLSGSESFSGSKLLPVGPFAGSGRGSLASDGRTNSWTSGGKVATLTHVSQPGGPLANGPACALVPESRALQEPLSPGYSQPLHPHGWSVVGSQRSAAGASLERAAVPRSPLYADPYAPCNVPGSSFLEEVSSLREEHRGTSSQPPGGNTYDLPDPGYGYRDSAAYHDYAELQSFQSDFSYDNLWDAEGGEPGAPRGSPAASQQFYQA
ncbi:PREDICTED: pleckstrin homology domain-containing family N member 1 [Tinamus guttatus]|uniref:pleckstrin homology domain-containing family N member 1 n=1 Tax=Tinamus guttatus TaxID=94827 RepID=UPI00052F4104|nr:PREDICTED: pleckstrin homology domain-containing family N member 1 [Tinamus guttatus]